MTEPVEETLARVLRPRPRARPGRTLPRAPPRAVVGSVPRARRCRGATCARARGSGAVPAAPRHLRRRRSGRARPTPSTTKRALMEHAGVAGLWTFGPSEPADASAWKPGDRRLTVAWLDDDPDRRRQPISRGSNVSATPCVVDVRGTVRDDHAVGMELVRSDGLTTARGPLVVDLACFRPDDLRPPRAPLAGSCIRRDEHDNGFATSRGRAATPPGALATITTTRWPNRSSGTPTTTASATPGVVLTPPRPLRGYTFSPPVLMHV